MFEIQSWEDWISFDYPGYFNAAYVSGCESVLTLKDAS